MRKSSLILLLAMAFVLTTVAAGFSSGLIGEPCVQAVCDKNDLHPWIYGQEIILSDCAPVQGSKCPCPTFDYELGSKENGNYCATHDVKGIIFKVCDCEKIAEFSTAKSYAIRLSIVEPAGGVYWTNSNVARADADCFDRASSAGCPASVLPVGQDPIRVSTFEDPALSGDDYCLNPCDATDTLMSLGYYGITPTQTLFDLSNNTENCCFTCDNNRVTQVQTCYTQLMSTLHSVLVIDIPTLVYDPNEADVKLGVSVKIKVELIEMADSSDICAGSCKIMCECLVDIGTFSECAAEGCDLCIPYMALGQGWWTGLALTNANKVKVKATITFYAEGQTATSSVNIAKLSVLPINVGAMLADLDLPLDKPLYAKIAASKGIQGFVTIGYGLDLAQGYLVPCGDCGCGTGSTGQCW